MAKQKKKVEQVDLFSQPKKPARPLPQKKEEIPVEVAPPLKEAKQKSPSPSAGQSKLFEVEYVPQQRQDFSGARPGKDRSYTHQFDNLNETYKQFGDYIKNKRGNKV